MSTYRKTGHAQPSHVLGTPTFSIVTKLCGRRPKAIASYSSTGPVNSVGGAGQNGLCDLSKRNRLFLIPHTLLRGLPLITIPGTKVEPGRHQLASGLAEAERRADRMLAARSLLEPAGDI